MPRMTIDELARFAADAFPQSDPSRSRIEEIRDDYVRVRRLTDDRDLRPGGTISGPTLMALVDTSMWYVVLAMIGPVPLSVTTNLNMNFLRKPEPGDLVAEARLLKLGRRLAVGDVLVRSDGKEAPVAHATVTYSIPPGAYEPDAG